MRRKRLLTRTKSYMNRAWRQNDLRNNVIVLFSLFYGVYFGFFIGLPLIMNVSYVLASGWLVLLGFVGLFTAIKMIVVVFGELGSAMIRTQRRLKATLQPAGWKMQSVH